MAEQKTEQTFWEHLSEFVKRLKIVLATFAISVLILTILPSNSDFFALTTNYKQLMSVVLRYFENAVLPSGITLFAVSMSDPITLYIYAAVVIASAITLPVFAYETYKFVDPALYPNERKAVFPFVAVVSALFIAGALFGFYFLAPSFITGMLQFFGPVGAAPMISIMDFYNVLFFTVLVSGAIFTMPAFFVLLVKFNVLNTNIFAKKRKYIYAALIIAALLISPGASPLGDLYLFVALAGLFEISILVAKRYERESSSSIQPTLLKFFAPPKCKYCNAEVSDNQVFCPYCKKSLT